MLPRHIYWEVAISFVPSFLALLTGFVLLPHQIRLLTESEAHSWIAVLYFPGVAWLMACVLIVLSRLRRGMSVGWPLRCAMILGLVPLFFGPVGTFAQMGYRGIGPVAWAAFVVLPLLCVLHLLWLSATTDAGDTSRVM